MGKSPTSQRIAEEAARLLARDEASSVDHARRKAAARIGGKDPAQLPDDASIKAALTAYQSLFGGSREASVCTPQRLALAVDAMDFMRAFSPELAEPDPPLADEAPLRILVYSEDPDAPLHHVLESGRRHRLRRDRLIEAGAAGVPVDVLELSAEPFMVEFWPLPASLRGRPLADSALGDPLQRRSRVAVQRLLQARSCAD